MSDAPVPLVDLGWQSRLIADEVRAGLERVVERSAFVLGPEVADFEQRFAAFTGASHCIGVGSGTDALELALRALGVGAGDEVVVPANTFIASALAVVRAGAAPVLVDIDRRSGLVDPAAVAAAIGPRTRALMPVHLYGQMAPMAPLEELAERHGIELVEDAAQSQGAKQAGRGAGSVGRAAGTSFYPGKNIGAWGDGGAVLCREETTAARVRRLRNWGSDRKYHHPEPGFNSRLDTVQAVVLAAKLSRLAAWNALRVEAAERYAALLAPLCEQRGLGLPEALPGNDHVWHLYVVRVPGGAARRDRVLAALGERGIGAGVHYPVPIHLQGAFAHLGLGRGAFPAAEASADEVLSLPLFPGIDAARQQRVVRALEQALD